MNTEELKEFVDQILVRLDSVISSLERENVFYKAAITLLHQIAQNSLPQHPTRSPIDPISAQVDSIVDSFVDNLIATPKKGKK